MLYLTCPTIDLQTDHATSHSEISVVQDPTFRTLNEEEIDGHLVAIAERD